MNKDRLLSILDHIYWEEFDPAYDLFRCHYSNAWVERRDAIFLPGVLPHVKIQYLCHPMGKFPRKQSVRRFHENEQNCNTCRYLTRTPFDKSRAHGLFPGLCHNEARIPLYPRGGEHIMFAPDDCMLQSCHEIRG